MSTFKDFFTNYAIFLGRRFYPKEKLKFLALAQKEFENANYQVNITQSEEKIVGEKLFYRNLYAGDFKNAKVVFATYYDTPKKSIFPEKTFAFNALVSKYNAANTLLLPIIVLLSTFLVFYYLLRPALAMEGFFSLTGLFSIILFILALMFIRKLRFGIPKRNNVIRNSSSVVSLLLYATQKTSDQGIAFAFIDSGTTNDYGLIMLEDYLKDSKAKVILLDSVGGADDLHVFTDTTLEVDQLGVQLHQTTPNLPSVGDVFLTSGELIENQVVIVEDDVNSDIQEMEQRYQEVVDLLEHIRTSIVL